MQESSAGNYEEEFQVLHRGMRGDGRWGCHSGQIKLRSVSPASLLQARLPAVCEPRSVRLPNLCMSLSPRVSPPPASTIHFPLPTLALRSHQSRKDFRLLRLEATSLSPWPPAADLELVNSTKNSTKSDQYGRRFELTRSESTTSW